MAFNLAIAVVYILKSPATALGCLVIACITRQSNKRLTHKFRVCAMHGKRVMLV